MCVYPARDLIVLGIEECGVDVHTLNVLYPAEWTLVLYYYYLQNVAYSLKSISEYLSPECKYSILAASPTASLKSPV